MCVYIYLTKTHLMVTPNLGFFETASGKTIRKDLAGSLYMLKTIVGYILSQTLFPLYGYTVTSFSTHPTNQCLTFALASSSLALLSNTPKTISSLSVQGL